MATTALAHSSNRAGEVQYLRDHLLRVASLAEEFASSFGAGSLGRCAGFWTRNEPACLVEVVDA
jgi:hypothetical protein